MAEKWTREQDVAWKQEYGTGNDDDNGGGIDWFSKLTIVGIAICAIGGGFQYLANLGNEPEEKSVKQPIDLEDADKNLLNRKAMEDDAVSPSRDRAQAYATMPANKPANEGNDSSASPQPPMPNSKSTARLAEARRQRTAAATGYNQALAQMDVDLLNEHGGDLWKSVQQRIADAEAAPETSVQTLNQSTKNYNAAITELSLAAVNALTSHALKLAAAEEFSAAESALAEAHKLSSRNPLIHSTAERIKHLQFGFTGQLAKFQRAMTIDCAQTNDAGTRLYAGVDDKVVEFDLKTGERLREFVGHTKAIKSLDVFGGDQKLVTGGADKTAIVWDLESGERLHQLAESGVVGAVAGSNDGRLVATAPLSKNPQVWSAETGRRMPRTKIESWPWNSKINALVFDTRGRRLFGGGTSYNARVWNVSNGREQSVLAAHKNQRVRGLAISPDGRSVVMLDDGGVKVYDAAKLKERFTMDVSAQFGAHVLVSADNSRFFAMDGVYDLMDGRLLEKVDIPLRDCRVVTATPDGQRFIFATSLSIEVVARQ